MVYIRTDANEKIATGHIMRCITIAEEIIKKFGKVSFIVSDENSAQLLYERKPSVSVIIMHDKWDKVDIDYEYQVLSDLTDNAVLLVDSYYISSEYLSKMKALFWVITFDDLFTEKKDADVIINYNLFYKIFDYEKRYKDQKCKLLLGEEYVPIRQEFRLVRPCGKVRNSDQPVVLIVCGGGDIRNMIFSSLQVIKEREHVLFEKIKWKVVIGKYYPYREQLDEFILNNSNVELYINIDYMAQLMNECDLCITAASTVLYECCTLLLPTLFFVTAKDQQYDMDAFSESGMMIYCGNFIKDTEEALISLCDVLNDVAFNKEKQQNMKDMMKGKIDGFGAERIADIILKIEEKKLDRTLV